MKKDYKIAEFIEINSHSLFSKYFSEVRVQYIRT
jgi:hypothetical protein